MILENPIKVNSFVISRVFFISLFFFIGFGSLAFFNTTNQNLYVPLNPQTQNNGDTFAVADAAANGKKLYATCIACHGDKGQGNAPLKAPALRDQEDWYIVSQLKKFKEGIRGAHPKDTQGMLMAPMAKMLTNEKAMKDVAVYIGTFKKAKPNPVKSTLKGDITKGKTFYATCIACHGDKGQGNAPLKAPALVGQEDWYIVSQLKKFKEGIRGSNPKDTQGLLMAPMAKMLPNEQAMKDVAAYILSLNKK